MKSSSGEHYLALDHVRAFAVLLVFAFHFLHGGFAGYPIPFGYRPALALFPFSILNQSHTGVAVFMTLSGYLFAKLLDGKRVSYPAFFWNRMLRLFPLLILVIFACGVQAYLDPNPIVFPIYLAQIEQGLIMPTFPNGAWSITIEMHFYLLLPIILLLARKSKLALPAIVLAAIALRTVLHHERGEVQTLAYLTLIGRIDQFVFGILAYNYRRSIANRHLLCALAVTAFLLFFWWFNMPAGYVKDPSLLSTGSVWIILPTLEGLVYGLCIAYYDNTFSPPNTGVSKLIGYVGAYSYSIYLLHFFVVYRMLHFVDAHVPALTNFYVACGLAMVFFLPMIPVGYLSFRFIESPFLKFRKRYFTIDAPQPGTDVASALPPAN